MASSSSSSSSSSGHKTVHFEARVGSEKLKHFAAALTLIQKVGKEVVFETEEHQLTLRSLNDAKVNDDAFFPCIVFFRFHAPNLQHSRRSFRWNLTARFSTCLGR